MATSKLNARDFRRYSVTSERAQGVVAFNGLEHDAVIADTSATGFGLLLMRGVHVELGQPLRLMTEDGIHECEVIYTQLEESFLHVGVKRLSDTPFVELKVFRFTRSMYKPKPGGLSFLVFIGVIVGFSTVFILLSKVVDVPQAGQGNVAEGRSDARAGSGTDSVAPRGGSSLRERIEEQKNQSLRGSRTVGHEGDYLANLLERQQIAVRRLVNHSGVSWAKIVTALGLSASQEKRLLEVLNDNFSSSDPSQTQAMSILTSEQREKLKSL